MKRIVPRVRFIGSRVDARSARSSFGAHASETHCETPCVSDTRDSAHAVKARALCVNHVDDSTACSVPHAHDARHVPVRLGRTPKRETQITRSTRAFGTLRAVRRTRALSAAVRDRATDRDRSTTLTTCLVCCTLSSSSASGRRRRQRPAWCSRCRAAARSPRAAVRRCGRLEQRRSARARASASARAAGSAAAGSSARAASACSRRSP